MGNRPYQPLILSLLRDRAGNPVESQHPSPNQFGTAMRRTEFERTAETLQKARALADQQSVEEGRRGMSLVEQLLERNLSMSPEAERLRKLSASLDPSDPETIIELEAAYSKLHDIYSPSASAAVKAKAQHDINRTLTQNTARRMKQESAPDYSFTTEVMDKEGNMRPDPMLDRSERSWIKHVKEWALRNGRNGLKDSETAKADLVDRFKRSEVEGLEKSDLSEPFEKRAPAIGKSEKLIADKGAEGIVESVFTENFKRELKNLNESRAMAGKDPIRFHSAQDMARIIKENFDGDISGRLDRARKEAQHIQLAAQTSEAARKATAPGQTEAQAKKSLTDLFNDRMNKLPTLKKERTEALLSMVQHGSNSDADSLDELAGRMFSKEDKKLLANRLKWMEGETSKIASQHAFKEPYSREAVWWSEQAMKHLDRGEFSKMFKAMRAGLTAHNIAKNGPTNDSVNLLKSWRRQHAALEDSKASVGRTTPFVKASEVDGHSGDMGTLEDSVGADFNDVEKLKESAKWQGKKDDFYFQRGKQAVEDDADLEAEFRNREKISKVKLNTPEYIQADTERRLKAQTSRGSLVEWLARNKKHPSAERLQKLAESKKELPVPTTNDIDIPTFVRPIGSKKYQDVRHVLRSELPAVKAKTPVAKTPTVLKEGGKAFNLEKKGQAVLRFLLKNEKPHAPRVFDPAPLLEKVAKILSRAR